MRRSAGLRGFRAASVAAPSGRAVTRGRSLREREIDMSVSVIMSAYNRERYVEESVESVLTQTYDDFELIIIDDASRDRTPAILDRIAARDARVRVVHQPQNRGLAPGRNLALSLARHDLVACMDDDDIMLPTRLALQVGFMRDHPEVSVITSAAYIIDEFGETIGVSIPRVDSERGRREHDPSLFLELIHPTVMFRRRDVLAVGGYRDVLLEDRDLWGRMVTSGYRISVLPDFVMRHRRHSSLMTSNLRRLFEFGEYVDFNVLRRLRGEQEVSLEAFRAIMAAQPAMQRLARSRKNKAGIAFRKSTLYFSKRRWAPFLYHLATAIALEPTHYTRRILRKRAGV
ncbi:glycosyltransferase family 2 protein [Methylobacterium isbiliense]|nr:glycosyltransferase [Methylobacterium isbiliense]